jgi:glycerate kinase
MRVVVAMDSFKGSASAIEVCDAVRRGVADRLPDAEIRVLPMADGGEGTADILRAAARGEWVEIEVAGPVPPMRVRAAWVWLPGARPGALVEMAKASGLDLLRVDQLDPMAATTFGTGELIADALRRGARDLWVAVGGSATVDGGTGAARALGWHFLNATGKDVDLGGGGLEQIRRVMPPRRRPDEATRCRVLCDVENPLLGEHGAARVFGPQKGATPDLVERLEAGLGNLAEVLLRDLGLDVREIPGAGAAGGMAAGAVAFLNAELVSGIDAVMDATGLDAALEGADWVITGEGRFDLQSLGGKVFSGVLARAQRARCRVAVVAGAFDMDPPMAREVGVDAWEATMRPDMALDEALSRGPALIEAAAARLTLALARIEAGG